MDAINENRVRTSKSAAGYGSHPGNEQARAAKSRRAARRFYQAAAAPTSTRCTRWPATPPASRCSRTLRSTSTTSATASSARDHARSDRPVRRRRLQVGNATAQKILGGVVIGLALAHIGPSLVA